MSNFDLPRDALKKIHKTGDSVRQIRWYQRRYFKCRHESSLSEENSHEVCFNSIGKENNTFRTLVMLAIKKERDDLQAQINHGVLIQAPRLAAPESNDPPPIPTLGKVSGVNDE